jgi:predicted MFS family arabinose efflux permease
MMPSISDTSTTRTYPPQGEAAALLRTAGLALGPAVALGFARFAYALLLPAMRTDLHWSYTQAGALNTANAVGYLVGAIGGAWLAHRLGTRRTFVVGLVVTTLAILASAASSSLVVLSVLRAISGASGAAVFIAGAALAAHLATNDSRRPALLLGVYFAGAGAGIVLSGAVVPAVLGATGPAGWPLGWLALAALALVASAVAWLAAKDAAAPPAPPADNERDWDPRRFAPVGLGYALFGAGYIAYATFIISYLRHEGLGNGEVSAFWVVLGLASIATTFAWGPVLARLRGGRGPAAVMAVLLAGAVLPVVAGGPVAAFASAVLFGGSFLTVVTAVTDLARRMVPGHAITAAIGALTIAFALGQCVGPVLAGVLSDGPTGVRAGLMLSAGILATGLMVTLAQHEGRRG